jgi:hypothetical protein
MDEQGKPVIFLECPSSYIYTEEAGTPISNGEARAFLGEDHLLLRSASGESLTFPYRSILSLVEGDYQFTLHLTSDEHLDLFHLGFQYENFLKTLCRLRNEILLKDMLMQESLKKGGLKGEFVWKNAGEPLELQGTGEPRLYDTGLVLIPEQADPIRLPYSDLLEVVDADYALTLKDEWGNQLTLRQMGTHLDPFKKALTEAMGALTARTQALLKEIYPEADAALLRKAGALLKEGKAARKLDLDVLSPRLWGILEKRLELLEKQAEEINAPSDEEGDQVEEDEAETRACITETYAHLKSLARLERMAVGIKRDLMGDLTGEYLWFLIPVFNEDPLLPGNMVVVEAISTAGTGKATYFFRMASRAEYRKGIAGAEMEKLADQFVRNLNRAMRAVNFRREPIHLSERQLQDPRYLKYQYSILRLPELQQLRRQFVGRVMHGSLQSWKQKVHEVLQFNVSALSDEEKWQSEK